MLECEPGGLQTSQQATQTVERYDQHQPFDSWLRDDRLSRRAPLGLPFSRPGEALHFLSAELSDASCKVLLRKMERMVGEFRDLADLDRTVPAKDKRSMGALLAVRSWIFSMFESLRAPPADAAQGRR